MGTFKEFLQRQATELPRLPVPPLKQTVQQYLRSVEPFLTEDESKRTKELATLFTSPGGIGEKLQQILEQRAANTDNWLSEWWLNVAYLNYRSPLPIYCSTNIVFLPQDFNSIDGQLKFTAALIAGSLDFKKMVEDNKLGAEKMGPHVLDMSQFEHLYSVCRIPGEERDSIRFAEYTKHIAIARNNHFFAVPVYDDDGNVLNQNQFVEQLKIVVQQSQTPSPTPIGILTTENRTTWFKAREALLKAHEQNRHSLDMIETSLFMIALDGPLYSTKTTDRLNTAAERMMCGDGAKYSANRWFDLMCQFIVTESGDVGMTYEHSPGDAHPIITNHIETYWVKKGGSKDPVGPARKYPLPQKLEFRLSHDVQQAIETAKLNMNKMADEIEIHCYVYPGYGKDFIRAQRIGSVDSFIQMAIQLAFYRLHKKPGAQYESAMTRRFYKGRTETIRSCSTESMQFAKAMLDTSATDRNRLLTLKNAIQAHKEYINKAMSGQGVDRHMLGLRLAALENGIEMPELFLDPAFARSSHMRLSTSQVPAISNTCGFYGPLVPDGYGCCYNPRPGEIVFGITAFNSCPETSATKFARVLQLALDDMKTIVERALPLEKL